MRRWLWPPSRVRCQRSLIRSPGLNGTPSEASRSMAAGAFSTTNSTVARRLRPAPAIIVSSMWLSKVSPGSITAAIPPCAQAVEPDDKPALARTTTRWLSARLSAAVSPAAPEPTTTTSKARSAIDRPAGQFEEDILEIGLAGRDVDDAEASRLQRRQHLAGIHPVLAVGDRDGARADQLDLVEAACARRLGEVAVDGHLHRLFPRHAD